MADAVAFVVETSGVNVGRFVLPGVNCPKCGAADGIQCRPGSWPKCFRCGVKLVQYGKTPDAECVTPNGRVDGHFSYVTGGGGNGLVCAFCGKGQSHGR